MTTELSEGETTNAFRLIFVTLDGCALRLADSESFCLYAMSHDAQFDVQCVQREQ